MEIITEQTTWRAIFTAVQHFYCPKYKLAVELDGEPHFTPAGQQYDRERTAFLNSAGIKVLRFENCTVFDYTQQVLEEIRMNLK